MNPEELIAKSIGEIAGKIIEHTVKIGDNFIRKYFSSHKESVMKKADDNAAEFISILEKRLNVSESILLEHQALINHTLNSPSFAKLLENTIRQSSLTQSIEKKTLLAELIYKRLFHDCESTQTFVLNQACEKIELLNKPQIEILCLIYLVYLFEYKVRSNKFDNLDKIQYEQILINNFAPYYNTKIEDIDIKHLEFLNCIDMNFAINRTIENTIIPIKFLPSQGEGKHDFFKRNLGIKLLNDWYGKRIGYADLSIVGQAIAENSIKIINDNYPTNSAT